MRVEVDEASCIAVAQSEVVAVVLDETAGAVQEEVEAHAARFARTRHFSRSIRRLRPQRTRHGLEQIVESTDFAGHIIEFGSKNNPPYAPFRKAASALGLRLKGGGERR